MQTQSQHSASLEKRPDFYHIYILHELNAVPLSASTLVVAVVIESSLIVEFLPFLDR